MNKWQKNVLGNRAEADERILKRLKKTYQQAEKDIDDNIAALMGRTDAKNLQSITYQIEYQKALKSQISSILEGLNSNQFTDISQYLAESYEDGFVGVIYDLQGQGIPLIFPIDQEQVVRSLKNNSKLSKGLWGSLAHGNSKLQNNLRSEISRGFSQGHSYAQIARSISNQMDIGFNKVSRIVRTESHRISNEAAMDAMHKAKDVGADVVKQWDSTLDKRTRPHHAQLDGQIRELDEPFEVAGHTAMYPGGFGSASEDIHCRCAVLQRARWALDEDELQTLKDRAEFFGIDKSDSFESFKKKYRDIDTKWLSAEAGIKQKTNLDARDNFEKILLRKTTKIKQGFSAFSEDDALYSRIKLVTPDGDKFDVAMHGSPSAVAFGGNEANMSPRLLASIIKHSDGYHGQDVRLISCSTGRLNSDDYCFAEELANSLGVTVSAPDDLIFISDDGKITVGRIGEGNMINYKPNERKRLK